MSETFPVFRAATSVAAFCPQCRAQVFGETVEDVIDALAEHMNLDHKEQRDGGRDH